MPSNAGIDMFMEPDNGTTPKAATDFEADAPRRP